MKNNKLRKLLGIAALSLGLVATPFAGTAAIANTGGGIGGGGGPGGAYSGFQWVSIAYAEKGRAYEKFIQEGKWPRAQAEQEVRNRVGNIEVCKNSNVIWFIMSQGWTFNFTNQTWPHNPVIAGTIENPHSRLGDRAPSAAEVQAFKDWDWNINGRKIANSPGYTIICSGAFQKPDETWYSEGIVGHSTSNGGTWTDRQPYSRSTDISPQPILNPDGSTTDKIGANNLHLQTTDFQRTEFGKLYDEINTNPGHGLTPDQLRQRIKDAKIQDGATEQQTVTLDDANKTGMAEGGVLNVSERTKWATITTDTVVHKERVRGCNYLRTWNASTGNYNAAVATSCSEWDRETGRSYNSSKAVEGMPEQTGFWQMISVICNEAEFDALMASDPTLSHVSGTETMMEVIGEGKVASGVAVTQKYNKQPTHLDFGDRNNTNVNKAKTSRLGFYDKECGLVCAPVPSKESETADPPTGLYGAFSDKVNSNSFEFFRDGENKEIALNKWIPRDGKKVDYKDTAAKTTTVTRWSEGTPSVTGEDGGKFSMSTKSGKALFTGEGNTPKPQTNWDTTASSTENSTVVPGEHTNFNVNATWASQDALPQILNVKWEYDVSVRTTIPVTNLGFTRWGEQLTGKKEIGLGTGYYDQAVADNIQGKCFANFGTSAKMSDAIQPLKTKDIFEKSTGSGTVNTMDQGPVEAVTDNPASKQTNLVTKFVRATTE